MRKTIFHSESVLHLESGLHLESFFHFFLCRLCSSLGLCFSVRFASLLATTTTLFVFSLKLRSSLRPRSVFSLRFVLHSLCFPLRICSSLRLWSSTEFGFSHEFIIFHLDVIFKSVYSSFRSYSLFGHFFFTKTLLHTNSAIYRLFSSTDFYYSF